MNARPRFINSAVATVPENLVVAGGGLKQVHLGVRYGVWDHLAHGPVLIDTGYGPQVTAGSARSPLLKLYAALIAPKLLPHKLPDEVLKASDWKPEDVRTVIITHFHADHICGLSGFSNARFMASGSAFARLKAMSPFRRLRHGVFFEFLPLDFEDRLIAFETLPEVVLPFGLGPGRDLFGTGEVLSIDLPGHALGHTGLLWPRLEQPLLYAADAQWLGAALHGGRVPRGPARLVYDDEDKMLRSLERLRRAVAAGCRIQLCHELSEDQP